LVWARISKEIEVVARGIIRDGHCGRRFACVTMRRSLTRMLVSEALKNSGWHARTEADVVNDGAKGMRSLVTHVAPHVATPMLDWFHLAMKLHAIKDVAVREHVRASTRDHTKMPEALGEDP
jgi:hypothetical protein